MRLKFKAIPVLMVAVSLMWAMRSDGQVTVLNANVPPAFGMLGYIQAATLTDAKRANSGGTLTINGIKMIVPDNSIIQMPANTLTWAQLFDPNMWAPVYDSSISPRPNPIKVAPNTSGLALSDNLNQSLGLSPWLPFNATVLGNVDVQNKTHNGVGAYIVGMILPISQDLGSTGSGFITYIDYKAGRFEVGGTLNVANTGTIVEINDPLGRFGLQHSPDPRWSVDSDNPTVHSGNGYPMCLPKVDPAKGDDPDCPRANRLINGSGPGANPFVQPGAPVQVINMQPAPNGPGTIYPDPWKKSPFMVGDYVDFEGIMLKLDPAALLIPYDPTKPVSTSNLPLNRQTYISANTVSSDKLAIYTWPGTVATAGPAYLSLERMVIGNGGASMVVPPDNNDGIAGGVIPLPEPRRNIVIRGWCTDPTSLVDIFAVDIDATGVEKPRLLGTVIPEPGTFGGVGKGNRGRFRFDVGKGAFLPATRTYLVRSRHGQAPVPAQVNPTLTGLMSGQYRAPMFTYMFADAPPGYPVMPINFDIMPFLMQGEGGNPSAGPLNPMPPYAP